MDERGLVGYAGYAGYEGLVTLIRAGFRRPVQIVRQFISNLETLNSLISQILRFVKGPQKSGESKEIKHIHIGITNPISWLSRFGRYVDTKV